MTSYKRYLKKDRVLQGILEFFLVALGSLILAASDIVFLVPSKLISGGLYSIGVTVQYFFDANGIDFQIHDIVTISLQIVFFLLGLFFLGKKFSIHTLLATILYPGFYTLFSRTNFGSGISDALLTMEGHTLANPSMMGIFLAALFGGIGVGIGVAITFVGNGSTGGLDIGAMIISKYTKLKVGIVTFILDGSVILVCNVCMRDRPDIIPLTLIGIVCAMAAAGMVEVIYVAIDNYVIVEVISEKYNEINDYIQNELGRGATILDGTGGYTGENRKVVKSVLSRNESTKVKDFIASIDKKAFVIFSNASIINGEGFTPLKVSRKWKLFYSEKEKEATRDIENDNKDGE